MIVAKRLKRYSKESNFLSEKKRVRLNKEIEKLDSFEASYLYKDLCYLYICMVNDEGINPSELTYLSSSLQPSFIRSLVDVGNLVDKLADISLLDSKTRMNKWSRQTEDDHKKKEEQKRNSASASSYSDFLYRSRSKNETAFANIQNVTDPDIHFLLHGNIEDVMKKPPIFFTTLKFASLTIEEKRSTIHRLQMIENQLPLSTRKQIPTLLNEIYQVECVSDVRPTGCCKACCIS